MAFRNASTGRFQAGAPSPDPNPQTLDVPASTTVGEQPLSEILEEEDADEELQAQADAEDLTHEYQDALAVERASGEGMYAKV